jgi:hypothetical protein
MREGEIVSPTILRRANKTTLTGKLMSPLGTALRAVGPSSRRTAPSARATSTWATSTTATGGAEVALQLFELLLLIRG